MREPKTLFEAAEDGDLEWITNVVERTLEYDINQQDKLQRTALHWAAELGHAEVVKKLLGYGCNPLIPDYSGRLPLHLASRSLHLPVLKLLIEGLDKEQAVAMANSTDNMGITPLFLALQRGPDVSKDVFEYLMHNGATYNTGMKLKSTVLQKGEASISAVQVGGMDT
ncbi:hypothetical protein CEUSTIGMA_g8863.t1 [Chlamydomonas eustigma]|uniref:Uncharacterized protein n=1 Tax=Chlamydomonas eustigma TaxID=1157962 RepID=A0A250XEE3_9CHLO|nr:hypothetical protein CEUSTIGMA_g8863.t1 [Chlamydomonas eustigma]|eukprot:GAX81433.1 hypothetical protein CEUSTIGMA_g8863.t1 [Chlamydomonas eustigma]